MHKRFHKLAAVVLAVSLALQQGAVPVLAEEVQTETQTQTVTEAQLQAEAESQPVTEAQTQAVTEAQTQPVTEAQTQAATEAQTQPVTEAQTQAATEAQTQPATEAQTQAATEAQTQPVTETSAKSETESETETADETETESEKETERSERENDGRKFTSYDLETELKTVLPYLFAAGNVTAAEDQLENQNILDGEEGETAVASLKKFSTELANGRSSSDVEVVNLYADEKGKLDTAQLDQLYKNHVIDVTKKYYVVNIIADDENQNLDFSGYDMVLSGQPVVYEEETQPGDIIYNFAAMDGDSFTGYKGTVTLASGKGLQGTYLAPEGEVNVNSDLSGAVYGDTIRVTDAAAELLRIVFITGTQETAAENDTESVTEAATESDTEPATEAATESDTESATEAIAESDTEPATEAAAESDTEPATENDTESATEAAAESESIVSVDVAAEQNTEETVPDETGKRITEDTTGDTIEDAEEEIPLLVEESGADVMTLDAGGEFVWYSEEGTTLSVSLVDAGEAGKPVSSGLITVKAAEPIIGSDGTVVFEKESEAASASVAGGSASITLSYGGKYRLSVTQLPQKDGESLYYGIADLSFSVDSQGQIAFDTASGWDQGKGLLTIPLYQKTDSLNGIAVLTVTDGESGQIHDAVFVVKDKDGRIIRTADGNPKYYISYDGEPVVLTGLAAGKYGLSQIRTEAGHQIAPDGDLKFEIKNDTKTDIAVINPVTDPDSGSVTVSAMAVYNGVLLTACEQMQSEFCLALFQDEQLKTRVSAVRKLTYQPGAQTSEYVSFDGLSEETYYAAATDEFGEPLQDPPYRLQQTNSAEGTTMTPVKKGEKVTLQYSYTVDEEGTKYPSGDFSYKAVLRLDLEVQDKDGKALPVTETFYVNLYRDKAKTQKVNGTPVEFVMNGASALSQKLELTVTEAVEKLYIEEVDQDGNPADPLSGSFAYAVTYPGNESGVITVSCKSASDENQKPTGLQEMTVVKVVNKQNSSVVKIRVVDSVTGKHLKGAVLVLKDSKGKVVLTAKSETFTSEASDIEWKDFLETGKTYYLSEVKAPSGYHPEPDVKFTVKAGVETVVEMKNEAVSGSDNCTLTVTKQVYSGENQVYAYDTTNGKYASEGRYTFYAALFSDSSRTKKVSDVQEITVAGFGGTTTFKKLKKNTTYYLAETDQYGTVVSSGSKLTVKYTDQGKVHTSEKNRSAVIQNVYSSLPKGYRNTGTLTITKKVTDASGAASQETETFYAGIYRTSDYSDTPTIVKLELQGSSSVSVKRRILLSGNSSMSYYIAEVDENGSRITDSSDFGYTVTVDQPQVTIGGGDDKDVTITNKAKSSKVTLYLTKKVYDGAQPKAVEDTFYAGLFKDPEFTKPYTKPIPMKMNGKSELTLKLSLNLGSASGANIYIAEVDADGTVIKNQREFGYEIKLINSTAAFTQEKREVQTILMNSVFGTTSSEDWRNIIGGEGYDPNGGEVTGNGTASAVETGDDTPVMWYLLLMVCSLAVLLGCIRKRREGFQ
ncbi:MAG: SpaA isopeptide-forming pilin-related protein [Candidatus Choladocola sp.]|nr:SpaA isopeptide-forming pilin-related protein [Candidatus Choladocola sp.]